MYTCNPIRAHPGENCADAPMWEEENSPRSENTGNTSTSMLWGHPPPWPCAEPPCFVLRRMSKTGGTFADNVLQQMVPPKHLGTVKDGRPVPCAVWRARNDIFIVGTMRNPCSWYTSLASFHSAHPHLDPKKGAAWASGHRVDNVQAALLSGNATRGQAVLSNWITSARSRHGVGYFTYHFWTSWLRNECFGVPVTCQNCSEQALMRDLQLHPPLPERLADCWLYDDTLVEDLERCLQLYSRIHPRGQHAVNMSRFRQTVESVAHSKMFTHTSKSPDRLAKHNATCGDLFHRSWAQHEQKSWDQGGSQVTPNTTSLQVIVELADPYLFRGFAMGCCEDRPKGSRRQ